jgi:hypothetical protein
MPIYLIVLNIIQILARFIVALQSFRLARQKNMDNFYWLAGYFFFLCLTDIMITSFNAFGVGAIFNNPALANTVGYVSRKSLYVLGDIALVVFIFKTFYQNRKSPFPFFLGLSIVWGIAVIGLYFLPKPVLIPSDFVTFIWFAVAGFQAYRQVSSNRLVEDWVKGRYLLIIVGNILMVSAATDNFITIVTTGKIGAFAPITNIALITGVLLFYLAWMMPEGFRLFLNRNYKQPESAADLSEEEILKKLGETTA